MYTKYIYNKNLLKNVVKNKYVKTLFLILKNLSEINKKFKQ